MAGLSVLTHMHTPPWLTSLWLGKTTAIIHAGIFPLSPRLCKNAHALATRVPSIVVHSHVEGFFPVFRLHLQDFAGFNHVVIFPLRIGEWCGSVLYSWVDLWVLHCGCICTGRDTVNSSPSVVCIRFSSVASTVKTDCCFPRVCW